MAEILRKQGNSAYLRKDYINALKFYTQSIANAPIDSPELALAYANRTAVLNALGKYRECLIDIQRAMKCGYPIDKSFKLLLREAQCYQDLGDKEKANISFNKAIDLLLNYSGLDEEDVAALMREMEETMQTPRKDGCNEEVVCPEEVPNLTYGPNPSIPGASSALKIEYNDQQGVHLVATRDIKVMFCSEQCRDKANAKYHIAECAAYSRFCHLNGKIVRGDHFDRIIRLLAMIGIGNLHPYFKYAKMTTKTFKNTRKHLKGFNKQGIFDSSHFESIFNSISMIDIRDYPECLLRTLPAARMREEFMQIRFDFLARMWEKKEYHDYRCKLRLLTYMDEYADAETSEEMMQISAKAFRLLGYDNYIEKCYEEVKEKINFKDKEMSNELRMQGNTSYVKGANWNALDFYSKSISNAPQPSLELALAYANRSAVLKSLRRYHECLSDIQHARNNGYPSEIKFKLQSPCNDSCSEEVIFPNEVPELTYGPSNEVPCASSAVRIEYNDQQGRHLVATKDIQIGDVLLIGENIAGTIMDEHRYEHCAHCHKLCYNPLPCCNCVLAMFCSEQCQAEANTNYHIAECAAYSRFCHLNGKLAHGNLMDRIIRLLAMIGIDNLTPYFKYARMSTKEQENMSNESKRTKGFNEQGIFDSSDVNTVFNLFSKINCRNVRKFLLITSIFTLQIPRCFGISMNTKSNFFPIAGLCLQLENTALLTSISKAHSNFQYSPMTKTISVVCFNPLSSLINHSCLGNTTVFTCGNKNVTIARFPIPKGSILTEPYLDFDSTYSKEQRQRILREKYIFHCKCNVCENDWPYIVKLNVISDPNDQEMANQLSLTTEDSLLALYRTLPVAMIRREFMQVRFDFLTRMWKKREYNDYRCVLIEYHVHLMHLLQGNRVMPAPLVRLHVVDINDDDHN
ncbi:hypothetical protein B566_EDAN003791 [Ephemera danica]|nr:hypothetical protein B566_EDAN003791 [Ephemera danica]